MLFEVRDGKFHMVDGDHDEHAQDAISGPGQLQTNDGTVVADGSGLEHAGCANGIIGPFIVPFEQGEEGFEVLQGSIEIPVHGMAQEGIFRHCGRLLILVAKQGSFLVVPGGDAGKLFEDGLESRRSMLDAFDGYFFEEGLFGNTTTLFGIFEVDGLKVEAGMFAGIEVE